MDHLLAVLQSLVCTRLLVGRRTSEICVRKSAAGGMGGVRHCSSITGADHSFILVASSLDEAKAAGLGYGYMSNN
jgi:hypothetical protein